MRILLVGLLVSAVLALFGPAATQAAGDSWPDGSSAYLISGDSWPDGG